MCFIIISSRWTGRTRDLARCTLLLLSPNIIIEYPMIIYGIMLYQIVDVYLQCVYIYIYIYSSVHVLVGACLAPSERLRPISLLTLSLLNCLTQTFQEISYGHKNSTL